jgi:hypothetical protein
MARIAISQLYGYSGPASFGINLALRLGRSLREDTLRVCRVVALQHRGALLLPARCHGRHSKEKEFQCA